MISSIEDFNKSSWLFDTGLNQRRSNQSSNEAVLILLCGDEIPDI